MWIIYYNVPSFVFYPLMHPRLLFILYPFSNTVTAADDGHGRVRRGNGCAGGGRGWTISADRCTDGAATAGVVYHISDTDRYTDVDRWWWPRWKLRGCRYKGVDSSRYAMSTASLCTSTITDYFLTIHLYFVYCVRYLLYRKDRSMDIRWADLKYRIPTKAELSISGGSIDCWIRMMVLVVVDNTEAIKGRG